MTRKITTDLSKQN